MVPRNGQLGGTAVSVLQHIQERADEMTQNPKVQIAAGTVLTATPMWISQMQTWLGLFTLVCGAVIGAHGVYKIFRPILTRFFNKP
jgi:hypothetical protein